MMFDRLRRYYKNISLIRSAIDTYPDGICFAAMDGRPILANRSMNDLCYRLTGHTVVNARDMWRELSGLAQYEPLTQKLDRLIITSADGTVWQFQRQMLSIQDQKIYQYEASDITELEAYRRQLAENIRQEEQLQERQRELMKNIVQNNVDKELLSAKMRIHDRFGQLLVVTKNVLSTDYAPGGPGGSAAADAPDEGSRETSDVESLFESWEGIVTDMENASAMDRRRPSEPEIEFMKVARMIGCKVVFHGEQPKERNNLLLLYAAIREALTNAVRHGSATAVEVSIEPVQSGYQVDITNNGVPPQGPIVLRGGLLNLRRRLEEEGASMRIVSQPEVHLLITLPYERRSE